MDQVTKDRDVVIIRRRDAEDVALIAADELGAIFESAHLLRSPRNAERLLTALRRALRDEVPPTDLETLYREIGLDPETA
jgi:antitoxin YefM